MKIIGVPHSCRVGIKKWLSKANFLMVDPSQKTWNTFFEIALDWKDNLKVIYGEQDLEN